MKGMLILADGIIRGAGSVRLVMKMICFLVSQLFPLQWMYWQSQHDEQMLPEAAYNDPLPQSTLQRLVGRLKPSLCDTLVNTIGCALVTTLPSHRTYQIPSEFFAVSSGTLSACGLVALHRVVHRVDKDHRWSGYARCFLPSIGLMKAVVKMPHATTNLITTNELLKDVIEITCTAVAIVFLLRWIQLERRAWQMMWWAEASNRDADGLQMRFNESTARDRQRFETVYVLTEFITLTAMVFAMRRKSVDRGGVSDAQLCIYMSIAPLCLLLRGFRCYTQDKSTVFIDRISIAFDAFNFLAHSWLAGSAGSAVSSPHFSYLLSILLHYLIIFVFPFQRAVVVVPVCYVGFLVGRLTSEVPEPFVPFFLAITLLLAVSANWMIERSKKEAFTLLERSTKECINEKVLRCRAEFDKEMAIGSANSTSVRLASDSGIESNHKDCLFAVTDAFKCSGCNLRMATDVQPVVQAPSSCFSAPAVICDSNAQDCSLGASVGSCVDGNCLPPDAMVWLECKQQPTPAQDLAAGDRVLCFDRLGQSLKHASITKAQTIAGQAKWVTVTLQDNTKLAMTADHPMRPMRADTDGQMQNLEQNVCAQDLQPGHHHLLALKVVPVLVTDVQSSGFCESRVSLSVQQPERHAIFVATADQATGSLQSMAVESCTPITTLRMCSRRTFVDIMDSESAQEDPLLQRSNSAPALLSSAQTHLDTAVVRKSCVRPPPSASSVSSASFDVALGSTVYLEKADGNNGQLHLKPSSPKTASLNQLLQVRAASLQSVGSLYHESGDCRACAFALRRGDQTCFKGALCERCHASEGHLSYKDMKYLKRHKTRNTKREKRATVAATDEVQANPDDVPRVTELSL